MFRVWQVELVDFGVVAERTANQREVALEKTVFSKSFVEFTEDVGPGLVVVVSL